MSDADQIRLSYVKEVAFGVTPAAALTDVRITSEGLGADTETVDSADIRGRGVLIGIELVTDRQVGETARVGFEASGDVNFELSYSTFDDWLEAALLADAAFGAPVLVDVADTTIDAAAGDNSFNHGTAWAITPTVNEWIEVRGFVDPANNGFFKVLTPVTATKIIVGGGTLVTEAVGPSVDITQLASITNGVTQASFSLEKEFSDVASEFEALRGMEIDTMSLEVAVGAIISGAFGFMGKNAASGSATIGTGPNNAAPTTQVMNAVDHVDAILEAQTSFNSTGFTMELANNLRTRQEVSELGPVSVGTGKVNVSGTLTQFFATKAIMDKYLNFTTTSIAIIVEDTLGNGYIFDFPEVRYTEGRRVAGGENSDIIADMSWRATKEDTETITIRIARFAA